MLKCTQLGTIDVTAYKETKRSMLYTMYIYNQCDCGFDAS